jgi:hypothetical protein
LKDIPSLIVERAYDSSMECDSFRRIHSSMELGNRDTLRWMIGDD